ncbi:MAG: DUF1638 domain-containing protein [Thermodesulfobacteriota bacterium]
MTPTPSKDMDGRVAIAACRVLEPELEAVRNNDRKVRILYLDQGLHRTPQWMAGQVQEKIDQAAEGADRVVLGYGLCSNGIAGVRAGNRGLIVPRCHDCISFFLGSPGAYQKDFDSRPGTYYLTPGWVAERKDPLGIIEAEYVPRYGRETAEWAKREELKHYTHIVLIDTGVVDMGPIRKIARENARFFKMEYVEIEGRSLAYFKKLIYGPYPPDAFIHLGPGATVTQEMFFD